MNSCCVLEFVKRFIQCCCCPPEHGQITLAFGNTEVAVQTKGKPSKVYVSTSDCNHQVCGADVNMVGAVITDTGFILFANIKSAKCVVDWIAEDSCCCDH